MVSYAGTEIVLVLPFRFEPMRSQTIEEFYPIWNRLAIGNRFGIRVSWFDSAHDELTRLWFDQFLLDSTKNGSWSTMDAPVLNRGRAGLIWGPFRCRSNEIGPNQLLNQLLN